MTVAPVIGYKLRGEQFRWTKRDLTKVLYILNKAALYKGTLATSPDSGRISRATKPCTRRSASWPGSAGANAGDPIEFLKDPIRGQSDRGLMERGDSDNPPELLSEIGAHLAQLESVYEAMGLTPEEAAVLTQRYR